MKKCLVERYCSSFIVACVRLGPPSWPNHLCSSKE